MKKINSDSRIMLHFSMSLEDGTEIESNFDDEAIEFAIGDGSLLPGFERLIFGMSAGERQMFTVTPENAFGQPNDNNVHLLPRSQFEGDSPLEIGLVFSFADASGSELPGLVIAFDEKEVTIDFNHPLAGRNILFDVLIHRVEPAELH